MPRAIKRRTSKKAAAEVSAEDRLTEIKDLVAEKQKHIVTYGGTALICLLIVAGFLFYRSASAQKAVQLEYEAYKTYYQTASGDQQEQYRKALELFQKAYEKKQTPTSLLYIASSYEKLGKYDDALKTLDSFLKTYSSSSDMTPIAYETKAAVELKKGDHAAALKTLDSLYASSSVAFKDLALAQSARLLAGQGRKEEANAKYRELLEKFKDSPLAEEAKTQLGEKTDQKS